MPQTFDELKQKYQSVIFQAESIGHLENVNMQGDKLFIRAEVGNEDLKNNLWNEIKKIDPHYSDLTADITINPAVKAPPSATEPKRKYTVAPVDSLSAIAERFYGSAAEYNRIFEANRNQLSNPNQVRAGQILVIPG